MCDFMDPESGNRQTMPELDQQLGDPEEGVSEGKTRPGPSPRACHFDKPGDCDGHAVRLTMNNCDQLTKHLWMERNDDIYVCRKHYNLFTRQKCSFPLHTNWWTEKDGTRRKKLKALSLRQRDMKELQPCPVRLIPLMEGLPPGMVCKACLETIDKDDVVSNLPYYLPPYAADQAQDRQQSTGSPEPELDSLVSVKFSGLAYTMVAIEGRHQGCLLSRIAH